MHRSWSPRRRSAGLFALFAALIFALSLTGGSASAGGRTPPVKPSIVIVHGAFADASGFAATISALQHKGYTVYAPANPLRGIAPDADSIRTFLSTIPGPIVLVGHSYGGAVITNAATGNPNVKALVYIAAYAPEENETLSDAGALGGGSSDLLANLDFRPYPGAPAGDVDATIKPASFRQIFAADVPAGQAAVMASSQRAIAVSALLTPSGVPAWKTIPSWYLVARNDKAIPPQAERAMAARAHAHTVEVSTSHAAMVSHPKQVTGLILAAATAS